MSIIFERIKTFLQTFGKSEGKENAEVEKLRRTEELFRKALQNAGVSYAVDEMKHTAAENAQESAENAAESVDESGEVRYNKKVPRGNDFVTQAMIWARSAGTVEGEEKAFTNGEDVVVVVKTQEGYKEVRIYSNQNASDIDQIYRRVSENNEGVYGSLHSSIGAYKTITSGSSLHSGSNVGAAGVHGQNGGIHRSQSRSNGVGSSQRGKQNRSSLKPVHYHFNEDGSTKITYSDGSTKIEPPSAPKKKTVKHSRKLVGDDVNVEKAAVEHFGRTFRWAETGYITKSGSCLDFSGRHEGASGGYRTVDHRDILSVYDALGAEDADGNEAMVDFMARGNVRVMPEGNGINLSVKPTKAQEDILSDFIFKARGEVYVDLDDFNGNTVASVEYPQGTRASKVLNDIRNWFDNGIEPQVSSLAQFRDIQFSRKATGEVVTISKGEMAKLHANYAGDKVFDKKSVTEALKGIDALQSLPAEIRNDFINRVWTGYNKHLHQQGFERFTEVIFYRLGDFFSKTP